MNDRHSAALFSTTFLMASLCLGGAAAAQATFPVGEIVATPKVVQTGVRPNLVWSINIPSSVKDFVSIVRPATIVASRNMVGDVRILGAGVTSPYPNGATHYHETMCQIRYNGAPTWTTIFDGLNTDPVVQAQGIVKTFSVSTTQGDAINFAGCYNSSKSWSPLRTSICGDYVVALTNGDACPRGIPDHSSPSLKSFLKPYLDESNRVKIGPMDVIVFMELTHADPADPGFDGQDLVLLITFRNP